MTPPEPRGARPRPRGKPQVGHLSDERLRFCEGLLAGKSVRQAYEESGFKARGKDAATNGRQLLKEPEVQFYLAARRAELWEGAEFDAERVIQEMATIAFLDPAEVVAEELECPEDIAKLPEPVRRAIVGWKYDRHGRFAIELASKVAALDQLAKCLGLYQADRRRNPESATLLTAIFWRYVMALHVQQGMSITQAMDEARANPEAVEAWGREVGLLTDGQHGAEIVVE